MPRPFRIVVLPGDGIGPEVTAAAVRVLREIGSLSGREFEFDTHLIGGAALRAGLPPLPDRAREACRTADAVLLGAVGDPEFDGRAPGDRPESGLLALRRAMGVYANLRPARLPAALAGASPLRADIAGGIDMLIVRELTGGLYFGEPRFEHADAAVNTLRYTRHEIARLARVAFDLARGRRRRVVSVDKANVLETSRLWRRVTSEVARDYPDVTLEHMYVDACAMRLVLDPAGIDVLLTENLFGDILSDEAGAICGSLGLLPSASLGPGPGLFEPVHGAAPSIAGQGRANPIGAIASAAMLLRDGLKLKEEGDAIDRAIEAALDEGHRTADIAAGRPHVGTAAMTDAIVARLGAAATRR
ncbi:MAG TPA: 3-isopropylmalate dehydrogenase [Vicinamibacterales bacterium]|nr:3-isopropylmalate dehydrogenase [Vicinamibacterales bacterium]